MLLQEFLQSEDGMVTTDWVFLAAYGISLSVTMADYSINGVEGLTNNINDSLDFEEINASYDDFGLTTREAIGTIDWQEQTAEEQQEFYDTQVALEDDQVSNAYQVWASRANDPDYANPALARERLAVLEMVMQDRGIGNGNGNGNGNQS